MATIIVKTEVEATPKLIAEHLQAYADKLKNMQFPHPRNTFLILKPEVIASLNGAQDMPVVVVGVSKGTPLAMVAMYQVTGDITAVYINHEQVLEVWKLD